MRRSSIIVTSSLFIAGTIALAQPRRAVPPGHGRPTIHAGKAMRTQPSRNPTQPPGQVKLAKTPPATVALTPEDRVAIISEAMTAARGSGSGSGSGSGAGSGSSTTPTTTTPTTTTPPAPSPTKHVEPSKMKDDYVNAYLHLVNVGETPVTPYNWAYLFPQLKDLNGQTPSISLWMTTAAATVYMIDCTMIDSLETNVMHNKVTIVAEDGETTQNIDTQSSHIPIVYVHTANAAGRARIDITPSNTPMAMWKSCDITGYALSGFRSDD